MPISPPPSRRFVLLLVLGSFLVALLFVTTFRRQPQGTRHPNNVNKIVPAHPVDLQHTTLTGYAIAPKLGNETIKAELGRASWKLLHTMMARFPDKPTADERTALQSYIHLFQRLYPCGECAEHFRTIIDKYPPQVSSRSAAAAWACHVHNVVNESLKKDAFDCSKIGDFYDCGCADDEESSGSVGKSTEVRHDKAKMKVANKRRMTGAAGGEFGVDVLIEDRAVRLGTNG